MSRNIYRRSNKTGTTSSDLVRDPLNTLTQLRAYPVTDTLDKTLIYVKAESGVYAYHYDSTASDDGSEIIQPDSGSGRWIKVIGGDSYSDEDAQDAIFDFLVAGTNITLTHDDAANSLTIDATDTSQLTEWTVSDGTNDSTVAHNDTVEFTGAGGITVTENNRVVTIDGSGVSGGSDNLGNHTATQNLDLDTNNIINVAEIQGPKINFKDATTSEGTGDYYFHGKYNASWSPASKPAKLVLYADDGDTGAGRGENISIQPPDASQLTNSYGIKLPTTGPVADKVLKVPSGYSGGVTGTAQLEWADHCCPDAITSITIGAEPAPAGDGAISWNASTTTLTFTPPDLSIYAIAASLDNVATSGAYSDLSGTPTLHAVATSGDYDDLANKPTIPTNNNQLTNGAGYTTNTGDITAVTAGNGLTGGGSSGGVTLNLDNSYVSKIIDLDTGDADQGKNIHGEGVGIARTSEVQVFRSTGADFRIQMNKDKGYHVGDTLFIKNLMGDADILVEATNSDTFSNTPTLQNAFRGYYAVVNVGGGVAECQFGAVGTALNSYHQLKVPGNTRIRIVCTANGIFEVFIVGG